MPTRPDTPCPLQMRFEGTGAILNELANTLCSSLGVLGLLDNLNQVLGTKYQLSDKLSTLLSSYVNTETCDFGRAYGELRRGWFCDVDRLRERLRKSVAQDESMRMQAIDRAAGLIVKPRTPPRRVWDLYSNRVLPFWVLLTTDIPRNLWAVSHSWVDGKELEFIRTRINGSGWTVPIPRGVDLDHVRIELLNLGAEYVWLDVLCLRQQVQTSHRDLLGWSEDAWRDFEEKRQEEWKLDVPTIGHVFRCKPSQVVITYFSGLGRPFRVSQEMLTENRSWLNRVWTVQETTSNWLLGGLTTDNFVAHKEGMDLPSVFHARLCNLSLILSHESPDLFALAKALRRRKGTYPADYVSALGLLLDCPALPIYETDMRCEDAWSQLLQQMTRKHRTDLLVVCPLAGNAPGSKWRPSWSQMLQGKLIPEEMTSISYSEGELLAHKIHDDEVVYWNYPYVIENCKFTISDIGTSMHVLLGSPTQLRANNCKTAPFLVDFNLPELNMVMPFEQDTFYAAVGMADLEYWVLGRISDRHEEMEYLKFEKIYTFRMPDAKERERLWHLNPGYSDTPIHYL
ncbi:hypothetical protein PsYK624_046280 [Phanerochaete sordida]|uniref:Heterokaryon incompatibility domain-containing protein n=1 Tax=Phanerochaete sordida TaxID=48140 RepID=A0A9P3G6Q1_9APHY|nr:hypothetical protein PsYK624_046280 [Phanerochaete sordida]